MRVVLLFLLMVLSCFSYAQDVPAAGDDPSTIHVSTQFVVLDALVETKRQAI
jgi:hypothetical protein